MSYAAKGVVMNVFDKICAVPALALGVLFICLGVIGLFIGSRAWFSLPPGLGVLPAFVGWGIVKSVVVAWKAKPRSPAPEEAPTGADVGFSDLPGRGNEGCHGGVGSEAPTTP